MTRSLPLAIETSLAVPIEELQRNAESSLATDASNNNNWEAQQPEEEPQSDDLDKLEQEIHQNSILLNKLHQIDVENNKFRDEQMLKSGSVKNNRVPVEEQEQEQSHDHSSSLEAIKLTQWRTISRTFAEGQFDVVLGVCSAVLMFVLVLLVFIFKCRSRFAVPMDQQQAEKQQQFSEDAERGGMLHRPEEVLRAMAAHHQHQHHHHQQQTTMHV